MYGKFAVDMEGASVMSEERIREILEAFGILGVYR
jgi:hypothetical protein